MKKNILKRVTLLKSVSCATLLCLAGGGLANRVNAETLVTSGKSTDTSSVLPKLEELGKEGKAEQTTAQVTSVSQLSDVQPTDWAFTALQSLVERYGCIAGYPNGTFRGSRATSRYEFAAGLNACLDKINELISTGLADKVGKEDLATLQKLQTEFAAELSSLKGRVTDLEAKTETLEAQQFSTTTKLGILAFFNLTGATGGSGVLAPDGKTPTKGSNTTFSGLVWLDFKTSFTGKDLLVTQLAAGNGNSPINSYVDPGIAGLGGPVTGFYNSTGTPFTDQTAGATPNVFVLRELSYQFPIFANSSLVVGPRVNFYKYFDNNRFTLFLNGASSFNSINSPLLTNAKRGAGAVFLTSLTKQLDFKLAYLAESNEFLPTPLFNSASNPNEGLTGGTNALTAEIDYAPTKDVNLRFLYSRTNLQNIFGCVGGVGATPSLPGTACGTGLGLSNGQSDVFVANFDWLVTKGFGLFGRYGISFTNLNKLSGGSFGNVTTQSFQVGTAFPDLFKEGAQGTISFVMPFNFTSGRDLLVSGQGNGATQYDLELSYFYPIFKNVSIVPAVYVIFNPNNVSTNPTVTVANLRLQFGF
ncbi:putative S-layer protein [Synechococcus sp. PCC 7502]|uniref:iron uptake porin n=1 Tax=Synechococcus sp. PCC 7502 TaxID=1173263 RepID=UPI00029FD9EA|nr:iron uptake porin [Synechococcus sp. PCC 7502]AFY73824.1 putative S-layer protein [Synechococcus sp. PCC 7502]